jgi:hypothetical protein
MMKTSCVFIMFLFLRLAACLASTLLETGAGASAAKAAGTNGLTCLPKYFIIIKATFSWFVNKLQYYVVLYSARYFKIR